MPEVKHLGGQEWEGLGKVREGTPGDDYKTIYRNSAQRCGGQPGEPCFCWQRHPLWVRCRGQMSSQLGLGAHQPPITRGCPCQKGEVLRGVGGGDLAGGPLLWRSGCGQRIGGKEVRGQAVASRLCQNKASSRLGKNTSVSGTLVTSPLRKEA